MNLNGGKILKKFVEKEYKIIDLMEISVRI